MRIYPNRLSEFLKSCNDNIRGFVLYGNELGTIGIAKNTIRSYIKKKGIYWKTSAFSSPDELLLDIVSNSLFFSRTAISLKIPPSYIVKILTKILDARGSNIFVIETDRYLPSFPIKESNLVFIPCYEEDRRDYKNEVLRYFSKKSIHISGEAVQAILDRKDENSLINRSHLFNLYLYTAKEKSISVEDVEAVISSASSASVEKIVTLLCLGPTLKIEDIWVHLTREIPAYTTLSFLISQFNRLLGARIDYESIGNLQEAVSRAKPKIFFRHRPMFTQLVGKMSIKFLSGILQYIVEIRANLLVGTIDSTIVPHLLTSKVHFLSSSQDFDEPLFPGER